MNEWSTTPTDEWNSLQRELRAHMLQTAPWGAFQQAQGKTVYYASGTDWSWLAIAERGRIGTRLFCPYGPTARTKKAFQTALKALVSCAKEQQVSYIRIEPQSPYSALELPTLGLKLAHRTIHPRFTLVKDLTGSEETLLAEMSATNRNLYRNAAKKNLVFRSTTDPPEMHLFLRLMREVAARNHITIHSDNYYRTMAEVLMPLGAMKLYIAELDKDAVATSLVFDSPYTRHYAHAAAAPQLRKLHPGSPLLVKMILDAKQKGLETFDFNGIAPPNEPNHPWQGFTRFKQSFGGTPVDMHGTWELPVKQLPYALYRALSHLVK